MHSILSWLIGLLTRLGLGAYYLHVNYTFYSFKKRATLVFGPFQSKEAALARYPNIDELTYLRQAVKFHLAVFVPHEVIDDCCSGNSTWRITFLENGTIEMVSLLEIAGIAGEDIRLYVTLSTPLNPPFVYGLIVWADLGFGLKYYQFRTIKSESGRDEILEGTTVVREITDHNELQKAKALIWPIVFTLPKNVYELRLLGESEFLSWLKFCWIV